MRCRLALQLLMLLMLAGCAVLPGATPTRYSQYREGSRRAVATLPLHPGARVGQFYLYRVHSSTIPPRYMSLTVIGRVNDLLIVELDEGNGYVLAYLIDPSIRWRPGSDQINVRRAWISRDATAAYLGLIEDSNQLAGRKQREGAVFDSEMTVIQTRPFDKLRIAGHGWFGEVTTITVGSEVRAATWRARDAWFGGLIRQRHLDEFTQLHAFGQNGAASFPLERLLIEGGWSPDKARLHKRWGHSVAEFVRNDGTRAHYYWPHQSPPEPQESPATDPEALTGQRRDRFSDEPTSGGALRRTGVARPPGLLMVG